jgi:2-hydroxy-6-oxo-6-(2'-aminophenyl)hexa-2,4-dienoate hydrolase
MEEKFVNVDGIKTRYFEEGSGTPVILIHGGGAGADSYGNWRGCIPLFSHHFRVLAVDMVGFGHTDKPDPATFEYSQAARNRHIAGFIETLKLGKAHLVGNSMGGCTSLGVAITRPELVDKLVLMGSAAIRAPISPELMVIMKYEPNRANMEKLVLALTGSDFKLDPEMVDYRFRMTQEPGTMAAYGAIMKWIGGQGGLFHPEEEIAKVKHKTLIVGGKQDKVVPPESNWRLSQLLDNSWLHLIPHCGHWAMIEKPAEFSEVTIWFLEHC